MSFLYRTILKGLLTLLPISLTLYLLVWIASEMEQIFGGPLRTWFPGFLGFPGSGFIVGMTAVFFVGLAVNTYITRRVLKWIEEQMESLPLVRTIYGPLRDLTHLFANQGKTAGQRVVMVTLGESGPEVLGLVTRDQFEDIPEGTVAPDSATVFVPFSYGFGGFTLIVPRSRIRETLLPADRALQLAITGWIKASK